MIVSQTAQSFYSRAFYYNLARHTPGIGMRFIVLLSVVITVWFMGLFLWALPAQLYPGNMVIWLAQLTEKLPAVTYKDDKISIDKPVPFNLVVGNDPAHDPLVVIDTNYKITDIDALKDHMKTNHIFLLFTEDKMVAIKNESEVDVTDLKATLKDAKQPATITHEDWKKFIDAIESRGEWWLMAFDGLLLIILFFMIGLAVFISAFVATLIDAVVVKIISIIVRTENDFSACMRLAAAARMPIVYISYLAPFSAALSWFIWILYLGIAAFDSKDNNNRGSSAA